MEYYQQSFEHTGELPPFWTGQDFEQCTFSRLDLAKVNLSGANFINCRFDDCTLTRAEVKQTKFLDVAFVNSRLNHVDFGKCNAFGFSVSFDECQLDYTVFLGRNMKKTRFCECSLKEAHFLQCDLTG